jgi:glutamyl-tRNA synthetase
MRARGLTVEALKGFIASQGASSSNLLMEWDQLWAWNKKVLDPIAPRFWALAEEDL